MIPTIGTNDSVDNEADARLVTDSPTASSMSDKRMNRLLSLVIGTEARWQNQTEEGRRVTCSKNTYLRKEVF